MSELDGSVPWVRTTTATRVRTDTVSKTRTHSQSGCGSTLWLIHGKSPRLRLMSSCVMFSGVLQMEVLRSYTAKQPDELSLQVADVVLVSQTVEDGRCLRHTLLHLCLFLSVWSLIVCLCLSTGWCEGERLRDGERGWFLAECAEPITCQITIQRNMQRMDRLQGLETNVWPGLDNRTDMWPAGFSTQPIKTETFLKSQWSSWGQKIKQKQPRK